MLDDTIQKRIATAFRPSSKSFYANPKTYAFLIVFLLGIAFGFAGSYAYFTPKIENSELAKLAGYACNGPSNAWRTLERHIGKKVDQFSVHDRQRALKYLLQHIPVDRSCGLASRDGTSNQVDEFLPLVPHPD